MTSPLLLLYRSPYSTFADKLAERCDTLRCSHLALKVFGDRSKYGLDLDLTAARLAMHALAKHRTLEETVAFAALYSLYLLPSVSSDVYSCAFVLRACLARSTRPPPEGTGADDAERAKLDMKRAHALAVARALLPGLEKALQEMPEKELAAHAKLLNGAVAELAPRDAMQKHRLAGALKYVQGKLAELQIEHAWLTKWMEASGFTRYIEGQGERA